MSNAPWWKGTRGEWYVVTQAILGVLAFIGPPAWPGWPMWAPPLAWLRWIIGPVLGAAGGLLALAAVVGLGTSLTAVPRPKEDAHLVVTGPYQFVRHPIYGGLVLAAVGWALLWNGWLTLVYALVLFMFFDIKSRREEKWLVEKYSDYPAYQKRVRKLIPFIY